MDSFDLSVESLVLFNNATSQALTHMPSSCIGLPYMNDYINTHNVTYALEIAVSIYQEINTCNSELGMNININININATQIVYA